MSKVWRLLPQQYDDLEMQLLFNRGLQKPTDTKKFFYPTLDDYKSEIAITNIKIAQKRIQKAIESQELIVIFGDYDVDGICSSAVLYKALTALGAKVLPYIPHRDREGYGLNKIGLEFARDSGASVVITVDNGIVAMEQAVFAKSLGLDLIITDHHLPREVLPEAFTIVHSLLMCGTAVAWCLIQDLVKPEIREELLQFVAIATVCDHMSLMEINRAFLVEGLRVLNRTKNIGLRSLIADSGVEYGQITAYEIGHLLGPRLNAIGRLEHAIDGLRLLCTSDSVKARRLSKLLCETNAERKELTFVAVEEAKLMIDPTKKIHILDSKEWPSGIIGLIAARVCEEYYRPAIAMSVGATQSKGSARSHNGLNIVETIRKCADILIDVGGHAGAAGFSIANDQIDNFKKRMEQLVSNLPDKNEKVLILEVELPASKLTKQTIKTMAKFAPFGFGNEQPLVGIRNVVATDIRVLKEKHLKFKISSFPAIASSSRHPERSSEGSQIDVIAFGMGDLVTVMREGQNVDIAGFLEINKFRGNETVQIKAADILVH